VRLLFTERVSVAPAAPLLRLGANIRRREAVADDRPSLIDCRTIIGWGAPNKQGTSATHGAALGADEVAAADEPEGGAYPEERTRADRERRLRRERRDRVAGRHHGEAGGAHARRAEAIAEPAGGQLHDQVDEEEHRREQPDDAERGGVRVGEVLGDRAGVGDVPARREADRAAAGDGSCPHARAAREMIEVVSPRTGTDGL